ncbi:ureidoglycolate lyase [Chelatococcus reniformis]|uniref:Ureidoglycolate lyase n=1 Tax=Chelatococcus reniformis TaxID=1494448 RepID=A0A916UB09_9HYPH|nr:ureidoglycolate lyase [Chelatococcus reniformis]GGC65622.1 ureidoglycolate lyase [Chelatococcus reniformis]
MAPAAIALGRLTAEAFAPFGEVIAADTTGAPSSFDLADHDVAAQPSLFRISVVAQPGPLVVDRLERHPATVQMLMPLRCDGWLVAAAPDDAVGRPDLERLAAFSATGGVGILLRPGVWHAPLRVIGRDGSFLVFMWRDGTSPDVEYADIAQPIPLG